MNFINVIVSISIANKLYDAYVQVTKKNVIKYVAGLEKQLHNATPNKSKGSTITGEPKEVKDYSKEGKFIDLPGAEKGKVVVRFPPEASG